MYEHQKVSYEKFKDLDRTYDTSDPGTGKTRVILELLKDRGHTALVVCPKTLMETAWVDDAAKFTPELVVHPVYAGRKREQQAKFDADVMVFNTDAVKWLAQQPKSFHDRWDCIVLDEISAFKHHTSKRSKAAWKVVKGKYQFRHGMTGTPNSNRITDIWHQAKLIDDGSALGTSFYAFRNATSQAKQVGPLPQHIKWIDKDGAPEMVAHMIKDFTIRHKFSECIDIPPNVMRNVNVSLEPKHRREYEKFKKNAIIELKDADVIGVNAAAMATKLLQIASGAVYTAEGSEKPVHTFNTSRYDTIAQLCHERDHSIIFFLWAHQRDELVRALEKVGIDEFAIIDGSVVKNRTQIIRDYQRGMYRVLLLHPRSAAHGITLTRATATIWASPTYDAELWKQGFHRMVRAGQENQTETILVSARNTIEQKVYDMMQKKYDNMTSLLEVLLNDDEHNTLDTYLKDKVTELVALYGVDGLIKETQRYVIEHASDAETVHGNVVGAAWLILARDLNLAVGWFDEAIDASGAN
jgi:SNF2 family DNA or RNA helicase